MKTLVAGYKTWVGNKEVLYAQHENGTVEQCIRNYSSSFNEKSNIWTSVHNLPHDVEFIGKYPLIKGGK